MYLIDKFSIWWLRRRGYFHEVPICTEDNPVGRDIDGVEIVNNSDSNIEIAIYESESR